MTAQTWHGHTKIGNQAFHATREHITGKTNLTNSKCYRESQIKKSSLVAAKFCEKQTTRVWLQEKQMENSIRKMLSGKQLDGFPVPRFDPEKKKQRKKGF